jgi:hypothetical protein
MTIKTPIRAVFSGDTASGLAEYQTGEKIGVSHGGTGAVTHTANALLLGNSTSAIQSSTVTLDGTTFATSDSTTITIAEGLIITGDLTVQGTTTSIDSSSINIVDRLVFEGSSADNNETTLIVENPDADRTITIPNATGQLVLRDTTDTLTNKTISGSSNTLSNIANSSLTNSSITINGSAVSLGGSTSISTSLTLAADSGSNDTFTTGSTLTFTGGEGIDTTVSDDTITIAGENASTSNKGLASFSSDNFSVSSGVVTIKDSGVANAELANSTVNFGGVSLALGASDTTPAFNLSDATDYPTSSLSGTITNAQLAGSIGNDKLSNSSITIGDESSNTFDISLGDELSIVGGEGVDTTLTGNLLTVSGEDATTSNKGVASFSSDDFAVSSGAVTVKSGGITNTQLAGSIANAKLANADITVAVTGSNSTAFTLGSTLTLAGTTNEIEMAESSGTVTIGLPNDVTIGNDLTVTGDFTVNGDTTTINTTNKTVTDQLFEMGNGRTGSATGDAGIIIERGDDANAFIGFDESANKFIVGTGSFTGSSTGNLSITRGEIVANIDGSNSTVTNLPNSALTNTGITVSDGSNSTARALGTTITFTAGEGMDVTESSGAITFAGEDATTSNKGVASFSSDDFAVSSGAVTVKASGITNTQLAGSIANAKLSNSSVTINGSAVSLGGSITITGSELSAGDIFSNANTLSSNATYTTASTKNAFIVGDISITSNAVMDIDGNGTLEIL